MIGFATNGIERLRINSNGKLLNGNASSNATSPDYSWKSDSTTGIFHNANGIIQFATNGVERFRIINTNQLLITPTTFSTSTSPDLSWAGNSTTGIFRPAADVFAITTSGVEKIRFSNSNNIQINTTTVNGGKLNIASSNGTKAILCDIISNADWQQSITTNVDRANSANYVVKFNNTDNFYVAGAGWVYSQGLYLGSDLSLKSNVNTISGALQKINSIRGVTYNLKSETVNPTLYGLTTPNTYMGIIAQEVELVAPEVVKTLPNGTKTVAYQNLIGLLIEAIKEQNSQIEQMKKDIDVCCATQISQSSRISKLNNAENIGESKIKETAYLGQNLPNPFSQITSISYFIPEKNTNSVLLIFDMNGKLIKSYSLNSKGEGHLEIEANRLQAGMYLYTLLIDGIEIDTKRMILTDN
ncbi:MAG TPA: tail fiber domain-containing protein [Bacteroidia bacterium]|nr:tail fiber domain-containing protein [Bacteroidia bacterium]HRH07042.1 tail fiber domain-containing protein [Bacteroidia bacterium]